MLVVEDIHTYYGSIHALKGVSLTVGKGEIVSLIGANGAGKSTTLMTISGVTRAKKGRVSFEGRDITKASTDGIVAMGVTQVPEGRMIFPGLTVTENLRMGGYLRKDASGLKKDLDHVLELFPILKERGRQQGGTLSGGEQQMLAIGRALMARPKLLLLDEPSLGLAPMVVENIFEVIKQISEEGTTVMLVEQNAQMALSVADRGYVLATGEVIMSGTSDELMNNKQVRVAYLGEDD
jgi:branched-chain amino acid transport system ATP-binding protein